MLDFLSSVAHDAQSLTKVQQHSRWAQAANANDSTEAVLIFCWITWTTCLSPSDT